MHSFNRPRRPRSRHRCTIPVGRGASTSPHSHRTPCSRVLPHAEMSCGVHIFTWTIIQAPAIQRDRLWSLLWLVPGQVKIDFLSLLWRRLPRSTTVVLASLNESHSDFSWEFFMIIVCRLHLYTSLLRMNIFTYKRRSHHLSAIHELVLKCTTRHNNGRNNISSNLLLVNNRWHHSISDRPLEYMPPSSSKNKMQMLMIPFTRWL